MENPQTALTDADYYIVNRKTILAEFLETSEWVQNYLSTKFDADAAQIVCSKAKEVFEKLLPELPYIGGDNHPGTKWIKYAGCWVSFYRPMKAKGHSIEDIGWMMYQHFEEYLNEISDAEHKKKGEFQFTEAYIDYMKTWAKTRQFEKDFIIEFNAGDGGDFDYGLDYSYCPIASFFKEQDAERLAPYFCLVDFPDSKKMGTGLVRTKTLANGDKVCNFRHKKGRQVQQDWSTEALKIRALFSE